MSDSQDLVQTLSVEARDRIRAVAGELIPEAHGMPSGAAVLTDALIDFVLDARPDLTPQLDRALGVEPAQSPAARLEHLENSDPDALAAVHLAVVAGYYADTGVRSAVGYPGQVARPVNALDFPRYIEEGLLDAVVARGPIWRDPDIAGSER